MHHIYEVAAESGERWCLLGCKASGRSPAVLFQLINEIYHEHQSAVLIVLTDLLIIIIVS